MTDENHRQELIEYAKRHLADLIPYDDPDYEDKLQQMAEAYAQYEIESKMNQ